MGLTDTSSAPSRASEPGTANATAAAAVAATVAATVAAGPVLIASDGTAVAVDALLTAGRLAASAFNVPVEVIGVCEPITGVPGGMDVLPVPAELEESRRLTMLGDVKRTLSIAAAADPSWPVTVVVGSPAYTLAREAAERNATLIVMGLGRHNPLDRLFGTETTLATLRESKVPVLAVGTDFPQKPQQAVVGLDFTAASMQAARLAMQMLGSQGHLTLMHVRPRFEHPSADWQAWDTEYGRTLPPLFEQVRHTLNPPDGIQLDTVTVRGDPAPTLLNYAQQTGADLIAVGTQRHSLYERLVVGSVATRVLRTARCAVLAVPQV